MTSNKFFGTDGIRGKVGEHPLVPEFVLKLGQAAGTVLGNNLSRPTIVIGRDTRASGIMLQNALTAGLLASGIDVIDAGEIPTPGVAYLVRRLEAVAGAVISASHNPASENGIKFFDQGGFKLPEVVEIEIENLLAGGETSISKKYGRVIDGRGMQELYLESLLNEHPDLQLNHLTIVVDPANGAASWYGPEAFARLGAKLIAIHASPTGSNINVECGSEFARKKPARVGELVQMYDADLAISFDGDADRCVLVDPKGNLIDGDHMLALLAQYFQSKGQLVAHSLVTTPMRNQGMYEFATQKGLTVHEVPVGDRNVVEKLLELRASDPNEYAVGAEQAGHIAIVDNEHTTGDGIRSALYMLRIFVESGKNSLSEFVGIIEKTPQVIASAYVGRDSRLSKDELSKIADNYTQRFPSLCRINLRYSGTEPLFRAMLEGDLSMSEQEIANIAGEICRMIQEKAGISDGKIDILNTTRGGILKAE